MKLLLFALEVDFPGKCLFARTGFSFLFLAYRPAGNTANLRECLI